MATTPTLHLISHTHWDREWYLTFQQFRHKLVHMVDRLLRIFETDPLFQFFMLDGQTIALEDYLAIRPEREKQIRGLIQSGRLLIGPWYIMSDEFLVSPEAIVRNLLEGRRLCQRYGGRMAVGYTPDPFGHIGQMPQILRGFGIDTACFWRGLAAEPCELNWTAPDGSAVLAAYLRDSYSNAANLPMDDPAVFTSEVQRLGQSLIAASATQHLLLMHGTDHAEPSPATSACLAYAQDHLNGFQIRHSTLPEYFAAIQADLGSAQAVLPHVSGELRASQRMPLLPGVLSTRIWIKQRNHACQTLLENWAEPFNAWAAAVTAPDPLTSPYLADRSALLHEAWRMLLQCHPHDSICGCSTDQVHDEMRPRFDQVEQIGEEVTRQSLELIASQVNTLPPDVPGTIVGAIQVFNPASGPRTDRVEAEIDLPEGVSRFEVIDGIGTALPVQFIGLGGRELLNATLDPESFQNSLAMVRDGSVAGMVVRAFRFKPAGNQVDIDITLSETGQVDPEVWAQGMAEIKGYLLNPVITLFHVYAHTPSFTRFLFLARNVPGYGYRTFWIRSLPSTSEPVDLNPLVKAVLPLVGRLAQKSSLNQVVERMATPSSKTSGNRIENEFFSIEADPRSGQIVLQDKRAGQIYTGLNAFVDGGDCGDEYNYCPPENDHLVPARINHVRARQDELESTLEIEYTLVAHQSLASDRTSRSNQRAILPILSRIRLIKGVARVEFQTEVENLARDHRLRVHFMAPFAVDNADHDGHYEIVRRPLGVPDYDSSWVEQPRPEVPQRRFTLIQNGTVGLLLAARGLPEVEVAQVSNGTEIRLTLLRCVGWLSRDDLTTRNGHAGPAIETPGAQMPGKHTFEYALIPFAEQSAEAIRQAQAFDLPLRGLPASLHAGPLPPLQAMVEANSSVAITCIKTPEDGFGLIVRGVQQGLSGEVALKVNLPHRRCEQVRLDETPLMRKVQPDPQGFYHLPTRQWRIVTLKFTSK